MINTTPSLFARRRKSSMIMKDVIIKVYVESSERCSGNKTQPRRRSHLPFHLPSKPPNGRKQGYDRRAQLLAYSRKLRTGCPDGKPPPKWSAGKSIPQKNHHHLKWRSWRPPSFHRQIRLPYTQLFCRRNKEWGYEHIATEDYDNDAEELCKKQRKKTGKTKPNAQFCQKIRSFLKQLSCFSQCSRGC